MKKVLLALAAGFVFTTAQAADFGVIDVEKVVQNSTYLKQQQATFQQSIKPQTTQIEQLQKDLTAIQQKAQTAKLTDAEKKKMSADFEAKATQLNTLQQQVQSKVQATMQTINSTLESRVKSAADQLRTENKLDFVLNKTSVLSYEPKADLTDKLIQKLNAMK